jgi:hypothetical protein
VHFGGAMFFTDYSMSAMELARALEERGFESVWAPALVVLWNAAIYFDSSALTAGTVQAADKGLRGATMGMCGYAGGLVGPLGVGLVLDWAGSADGWGLTFGHLALIIMTGLFFLRRLGARSAVQTVAASSA